jgi:methylated-DNA-[protein]-cysteine S-methyltransferase
MRAYDAPGFGVGELWFDGDRLVWHELPVARAAVALPDVSAEGAGRMPPTASSVTRKGARVGREKRRERGDYVAERMRAFFAGEDVSFDDVDLDLDWVTPFQGAVAETLRRVPRGEVVTYGELAALAGYPNAQRAAGTFCAGNRFGIVIPCHRVVSASGLGSYGSLGVDYKRRLLALEGVVVDGTRPVAPAAPG